MKYIKLKNISKQIKDGTHGSYSRVDNGRPLLSAKNIKSGLVVVGNNESQISEDHYNEIVAPNNFKKGDLLFTTVGTIGEVAKLNVDGLAFQRSVSSIRLKNKTSYGYVFWQLQSHNIMSQIKDKIKTTAQPGVYLNDLKNVVFLMPSLDIQQKIANFLDLETAKIDKEIELLEKKVELLNEYQQSLIFETVTKGLDKTVRMKDSGIEWIGEIPEHWEVKRVKDLFAISRGRVISTTAVEVESTGDNMYPVYSASTTNNGLIGYISTYDYEKDLLTWTTDGAKAGGVFIRNGKYNCTNVCGTLLPFKKLNLQYYCYLLKWLAPIHKRSDINGGKIMNNEMANIKVLILPIVEQKCIADEIDLKVKDIMAKSNLINKKISLLKEYKQSLIYEAVTGKLEIN